MLRHQGTANCRQGSPSSVDHKPVYLPRIGEAGGDGVRNTRGEKCFEKAVGGRRDAAFSRRDRARNRGVDQRPVFGRNIGPCHHVNDQAQPLNSPDVLRTDSPAARS